jgi:hypothetical protein
MKRILLIAFCLIIQFQVFSQKNDSITRESQLRGKKYKAWHHFDTLWTRNIFPACLLENHLKLSCAECESIYFDVQLKINSAGKLVSHKVISSNMCGKDITTKLVKCCLDFFYFIEFPPELRNIILEVKLGNGLKC